MTDPIERSVGRWRDADLISADQARSIVDFEAQRRHGRTPLAAQILGYLGGSLTLAAALVIVAQYWGDLESWARLLLIAMATGVLAASGAVLRRSEESTTRALASFLWFLSSGAAAAFAALFAVDVVDTGPRATALWAAMAATAYSLVLWMAVRTSLQHVALFAAAVALAVSSLLQIEATPWDYLGLAVWGFGTAWALLAWAEVVPPVRVAYAVASIAMLGGAQALGFQIQSGGLFLGLGSGIAMIAAGALVREGVFLGFGAAGVFVFIPQVVFEYVGDTLGAPLALFVSGVALVGAGVGVARLRPIVTESA